ncbi:MULTISPECIES: helix-turn-helix domain-containing protein [Frankia]|uniref:winged helix-turn-helix transcriptional regulator n=1 Tax=Frankia TaxID=1854 RepID=UPI0002FFC5D6|nr:MULTISPECIES: helix-turn-helix domain-containing protein [Frankia]ORT51600.1 hypothetical protein KBI5_11240 [Frankia sp. KB5]
MLDQHDESDCPAARALGLIGDHWSLLIIREAFGGARRYDDFRTRLKISDHTLTRRLDRLVDRGILQRRLYQPRPPRSEYELTSAGRDLAPILMELGRWGSRWTTGAGPDRSLPASLLRAMDE